MAGDLHTHSTCSDGSVPIHRLPLMAARLGLSALALSDHDTTLSARYAYDHPVQDGVRLIPAAELTGYDFERSHRVHLLTFWPDLDCPALRRHCDIMRQRRNECALQSCREIEALYPSSAPSRRWSTLRTAASSSRAASCRRCSSWACATASTPGFITSCSAGSRGASASTPRLPAGAGGAGHGQSLRGGGGVRPPDGVQEYAPAAGAGGRRGHRRHRGASPPQQPRGQDRVR
ncbi:MAG: PHP domain-containing protein [Faecalibacterium prausnitzii]